MSMNLNAMTWTWTADQPAPRTPAKRKAYSVTTPTDAHRCPRMDERQERGDQTAIRQGKGRGGLKEGETPKWGGRGKNHSLPLTIC